MEQGLARGLGQQFLELMDPGRGPLPSNRTIHCPPAKKAIKLFENLRRSVSETLSPHMGYGSWASSAGPAPRRRLPTWIELGRCYSEVLKLFHLRGGFVGNRGFVCVG